MTMRSQVCTPMPKQTCENLPPAKRQMLIDLALAEFAEHPYAVVSLSRIVERAGILLWGTASAIVSVRRATTA